MREMQSFKFNLKMSYIRLLLKDWRSVLSDLTAIVKIKTMFNALLR